MHARRCAEQKNWKFQATKAVITQHLAETAHAIRRSSKLDTWCSYLHIQTCTVFYSRRIPKVSSNWIKLPRSPKTFAIFHPARHESACRTRWARLKYHFLSAGFRQSSWRNSSSCGCWTCKSELQTAESKKLQICAETNHRQGGIDKVHPMRK